MTETNTNLQNQTASIRNLEVQVGQLTNMLMGRQQGNLPSTTEINPKEQCKAITLRSGADRWKQECRKRRGGASGQTTSEYEKNLILYQNQRKK